MYDLPARAEFSCTLEFVLKGDRVFFKRGRLFLKRGHLFKKGGGLFLYHTPLFVVNLRVVFAVYGVQVVFGKSPVYVRAYKY